MKLEWQEIGLIKMKKLSALSAYAGLLAGLCSPLMAQDANDDPIPELSPIVIQADPNGVNMTTGKAAPKVPVLSIPAAPRLKFDTIQNAAPSSSGRGREDLTDGTEEWTGTWTVNTYNGTSETFFCETDDTLNSGTLAELRFCHSKQYSGSAINYRGTKYTEAGSGVFYYFGVNTLSKPANLSPYREWFYNRMVGSISYPDGEVLYFSYDTSGGQCSEFGQKCYRPTKISSNTGYHMTISYRAENFSDLGWGSPSVVTIASDADPTVPLAQFTYTEQGMTDLAGRFYAGVTGGNLGAPTHVTSYSTTLPGESSATVVATKKSNHPAISSITADGATYNYTYSNLGYDLNGGNVFTDVRVTGPEGYNVFYDTEIANDPTWLGYPNRVISVTNSVNQTTSYDYDGAGRVYRTHLPEGNRITLDYDMNGNVVQRTVTAKPGSGQSTQTESVHYDYSGIIMINTTRFGSIPWCLNKKQCWRPVWSKDAKSQQTDYEYNSYWQLARKVEPAVGGERRETQIGYDFHQTAKGSQISRQSSVKICAGRSACEAGNYDAITEYTYWHDTFLPETIRQIDPANPESYLETRFTYDEAGRVLSKDGPKAGTDDAVHYRYDIVGRKIYEILPADNNGVRLATRTTYRGDDQVKLVEQGTLTDLDALDFIPHSQTRTHFDGRRRATKVVVKGDDGAITSVVQKSHDGLNRPVCTAQRMNPNIFSSISIGACQHGEEGAFGPDRITKTIYDAAGQVLQVREGVGTAIEAAEVTYTYTPNGQIEYLIDANGNKTKYVYDGFDRLIKWRFPAKAGAASFDDTDYGTAIATAGSISGSDMELYEYDANGNRTRLTKRDGSTIDYAYDALDRMTSKVLTPFDSAMPANWQRSVHYDYDLRGLQTAARFDSSNGPEGIFTQYDGFGRMVSTTDTVGGKNYVLGYTHDRNSNRTSITHDDNVRFDYTYDGLDRLDLIADNAPSSLFNPDYDDQGRLSQVYRNGAAIDTTYTYDTVGRLATLKFTDVNNSAKVRWVFTRNPASQIASETRFNDSYAFPIDASYERDYAANGLNQYTGTVLADGTNAIAYCFDKNGNLTADGQYIYRYDVENRLRQMREQVNTDCDNLDVTGAWKAGFGYDPLGRLYKINEGLNSTRLLHDGDALVAEYDDGNDTMLRRYVHGANAAADDPLVWYEGAGVARADRRYLHADARGSIVLVADAEGNTQAINAYDEYGIPTTDNGGFDITTRGRFRYTGQLWLPELGMYYYKARVYSPALGRFMQTDPIGYEDQFNLYAYVGNDPVNKVDPSGMQGCSDMSGQGLSGTCMDASSYNETKDGTNTTVSSADVDSAAASIAPSLENSREERGTTIDRGDDGTLGPGNTAEGERTSGGQQTGISPNDNTEAVIHSHPNNDNYGIEPGYRNQSSGDHIAVERGQPNYITRDGTVIVVERSQGQYRVRVVSGKLSGRDRREIRSRLNNFQRASRKRGM